MNYEFAARDSGVDWESRVICNDRYVLLGFPTWVVPGVMLLVRKWAMAPSDVGNNKQEKNSLLAARDVSHVMRSSRRSNKPSCFDLAQSPKPAPTGVVEIQPEEYGFMNMPLSVHPIPSHFPGLWLREGGRDWAGLGTPGSPTRRAALLIPVYDLRPAALLYAIIH